MLMLFSCSLRHAHLGPLQGGRREEQEPLPKPTEERNIRNKAQCPFSSVRRVPGNPNFPSI